MGFPWPGIYDLQIVLKGYPFLHEEPKAEQMLLGDVGVQAFCKSLVVHCPICTEQLQCQTQAGATLRLHVLQSINAVG